MPVHPENDKETNELIEWVEKQEVVDIWCNGCKAFRKMNAVYAPYLNGEIDKCKECRRWRRRAMVLN